MTAINLNMDGQGATDGPGGFPMRDPFEDCYDDGVDPSTRHGDDLEYEEYDELHRDEPMPFRGDGREFSEQAQLGAAAGVRRDGEA